MKLELKDGYEKRRAADGRSWLIARVGTSSDVGFVNWTVVSRGRCNVSVCLHGTADSVIDVAMTVSERDRRCHGIFLAFGFESPWKVVS